MKKYRIGCIMVFGLMSIFPLVKGQNSEEEKATEEAIPAFQIKFYPTSLLRKEVRLGFERQTSEFKSIEVSASYLGQIKTYDTYCHYCLKPFSYTKYKGRGGGLMFSWLWYKKSTSPISGNFDKISVNYNRVELVPDQKRTAILKYQNQLGVQLLLGKQFAAKHTSAGVFTGLGFYYYWGNVRTIPFPGSTTPGKPSGVVPQILLGMSLGAGKF